MSNFASLLCPSDLDAEMILPLLDAAGLLLAQDEVAAKKRNVIVTIFDNLCHLGSVHLTPLCYGHSLLHLLHPGVLLLGVADGHGEAGVDVHGADL